MSTQDTRRVVTIRRVAQGSYVAVNARGGEMSFGSGENAAFTPVELLLAAIGGCSGIDVDLITARRSEPAEFGITVVADSVRDDSGNHLEGIEVTFRVRFDDGAAGDAARAVLPEAISRSHSRLCTVSRTVEIGTPVAMQTDLDQP